MRLSIITPSFRNSAWLKLCIASVADQGVALEHIVQDAGSDDGTLDWLPSDPRVRAFVEKDSGMYDAVNRGLRRAEGDILAYLNCDEQYLPGALKAVAEFFTAHPEVDVVFAHAVVVDEFGRYFCDRTSLTPQRWHTLVSGNLAFLTCATFFRRRIISELGLFFDLQFRVCGDVDWALKLLDAGVTMRVLPRCTSVFTETGGNLSLNPRALAEQQTLRARAPWLVQRLRALVVAHFRLRRLLGGAYSPQPHSYSIYTRQSPDRRQTFTVENPTYRWHRKPGGG